MRTKRGVLGLLVVGGLTFVACGGGGTATTPDDPVVVASPTPTPTPGPTPPAPCQLTAPTVDCASRKGRPQELAEVLQAAIDRAVGKPGVMYADGSRLYDVNQFRSTVVEVLDSNGVCGAWDYGNFYGDEIFTRTADGCVVEQYDLITGEGGVRNPNRKTNLWSGDFYSEPPPPMKPDWPKEGDLSCNLPGERLTYCISIKGTGGEFGPAIYALIVEMLAEHPELVDKGDFLAGQGAMDPGALRLPAWRITNVNRYVQVIEETVRAHGFCGYVEKGDILKVKSLVKGNLLHEEMDIVQNPTSDASYTSFVVKDRCHNAGF